MRRGPSRLRNSDKIQRLMSIVGH